jgi:glycosyltransferase involved in cell wall biosynthesis
MYLSIIIPVYNEADHVEIMLQNLSEVEMPGFLENIEFLIVDDHSSDDSVSILKSYVESRENFRLFIQNKNMGKGAAVRRGLAEANGDVFLVQDADLELSPNDIPRMLIAMHELGVEFINGSRYLPGIVRPLASYRRYLGNRLFSWLTSILINVRITDMACGYKLFHRNIVEQITLKENRFGFEAELILKALRLKRNNIAEVPVQYFPRNEGEGKKLNTWDAFKIFKTIFQYAFLKQN